MLAICYVLLRTEKLGRSDPVTEMPWRHYRSVMTCGQGTAFQL